MSGCRSAKRAVRLLAIRDALHERLRAEVERLRDAKEGEAVQVKGGAI